jgi:hypothetical protein
MRRDEAPAGIRGTAWGMRLSLPARPQPHSKESTKLWAGPSSARVHER